MLKDTRNENLLTMLCLSTKSRIRLTSAQYGRFVDVGQEAELISTSESEKPIRRVVAGVGIGNFRIGESQNALATPVGERHLYPWVGPGPPFERQPSLIQ